MPVITPPGSTPLPTPPSTASPSTFDSRADAFLGALPAHQAEQNALAANVAANATDAAASATTAATQAGAATTQASAAAAGAVAAGLSAGATAWSAATAYALGQRAIDPTNGRVYRRLVAGTTGAQPNADSINWGVLDFSELVLPVAGTTGTVFAGISYRLNNAAQTSLVLDAALADSAEFGLILANGRTDNSLDIGARTLFGPAGSTTGVVVFDTQQRVWEFKHHAASNSLEMI